MDEIYDSLDKHVAAVSDGIGQSQAILMREFEGQIESIRALTHKSGTCMFGYHLTNNK